MRSALAPACTLSPAQTQQDPVNVTYDAWFRAKVHEALNDVRPGIAHQQVMDEVQALIDSKCRANP